MTTTLAATAEFEKLLVRLKKVINDGQELIAIEDPPERKIRFVRNQLEMHLQDIQEFHPANKTKEKEVSYNFEEAVDHVLDGKTMILKLDLYLPNKDSSETRAPSSNQPVPHGPKLTVIKFNGDITKYAAFKTAFEATVG